MENVTDNFIFSEMRDDGDGEKASVSFKEIDDLLSSHNKENANVPRGPEAVNLAIAEAVMKDYALNRIFSPDVKEAHKNGTIKIHDLGMAIRPYCSGQNIAYVAKYGLDMPTSLSSAKPAKSAEILIEHIVKFSAMLQCNFAGAIGWDAVNTFIAPYLRGYSDKEIKQCAQMLLYEFAQQAIARGGQSLSYDTPIILRKGDRIEIVPIGEFCEEWEFHTQYTTPSLNLNTREVEWKKINHVYIHNTESPLKRVTLRGGRRVVVTEDHSLFTQNEDGTFREASAKEKCDYYLVADHIPIEISPCKYDAEDAWAFGVMAVDGSILDNRYCLKARLATGDYDVAERFAEYCRKKFEVESEIACRANLFCASFGKGAGEFFSLIGKRVQDKMIPPELLTAPDDTVASFFSGFARTNRCFFGGQYLFSMSSKTLCDQMQFLLNRMGIGYTIDQNGRGEFRAYSILISSEGIKRLMSKRKGVVARDELQTGTKQKCGGRCTPYKTKSIKDALFEERVYDIGVDDNENFILPNGIVCHNSTFSDLNVYWEVPKHYRDVPAIGPGGAETGLTYGDYKEESKKFAKAMFEVYKEGDSYGRPFFFPKAQVHISKDMFLEEDHEEFLDLICQVASEKGNTYFLFDRGDDVVIAQCCFDGNQFVAVRGKNKVLLARLKDLREGEEYEAPYKGAWRKCRLVKTPRGDRRMYRIRTYGEKEYVVTEDHIFPMRSGDRMAKDIKVDEYILTDAGIGGAGYTFHQGAVLGMFLKDGYTTPSLVLLSTGTVTRDDLDIVKQAMSDWGMDDVYIESIREDPSLSRIKIHTHELNSFFDGFRVMDNKKFAISPEVLNFGEDFRRGIVWGMTSYLFEDPFGLVTDNENYARDMEWLQMSLGQQCVLSTTKKKHLAPKIRVRKDQEEEDVYTVCDFTNYCMVRVECAEPIEDYTEEYVYCLEMLGEEPYFTLPSGAITHNCRLKIALTKDDVEEAKEPWKVRHTAFNIVTVNLPRIAVESGPDVELFLRKVSEAMELSAKANDQKYEFLWELMKGGKNGTLAVLNMDHDGTPYFRMEKSKGLIGMVGLNETVKLLTGKELHEGTESVVLGLRIISYMNKECERITKEHGITTILEQTPAESTAYKLAKWDAKEYEGLKDVVKGNLDSGDIYYTNSTYLDVGADVGAIERIKTEGKFHALIPAGALTHIWMGEHRPDPQGIKSIVLKTFHNTTNSQIAFSPEFTSCLDCKSTFRGLEGKCPTCGSANIEGITRVTGFFSKVNGWNPGKVQELKDRKRHDI